MTVLIETTRDSPGNQKELYISFLVNKEAKSHKTQWQLKQIASVQETNNKKQ